jgi:hypothetical protein
MWLNKYLINNDETLTTIDVATLCGIEYLLCIKKKKQFRMKELIKFTKGGRSNAVKITKRLEKKGWLIIERVPYQESIYSFHPDKVIQNLNKDVQHQYTPLNDKCTTDVQAENTPLSSQKTEGCALSEHNKNTYKNTTKKQESVLKDSAAFAAPTGINSKTTPSIGGNKNSITNAKELGDLWLSTIKSTFPNTSFVSGLEKKDYAFLKSFITKVQPYDAREVIALVIKDWKGFSAFAKDNFGGSKPHTYPTIYYLSYNVDAALNYYACKKDANDKDLQLIATKEKVAVADEESKCKVVAMQEDWKEYMAFIGHDIDDGVVFSSLERLRASEFVASLKDYDPIEVFRACLVKYDKFLELAGSQVKLDSSVPTPQIIFSNVNRAVACYKNAVNAGWSLND